MDSKTNKKNNGEILGEYAIYNGKPVDINDFDVESSKKLPGVYEVIRIIDGVPLFMENHMERFRYSASLLGWKINLSDEDLYENVINLLRINNLKIGNIKLIVNMLSTSNQQVYAFIIKSRYPSKTEVDEGVKAILYHAERENPNAKSINLSYREMIDRQISTSGAYEALLVNKENEITEGSRSNFFAVKDKLIFTSPLKDVLPGVTRGMVLEICSRLGLTVVESPVYENELKYLNGIFMTGTSPQVLPISSVGDMKFQSAQNKIIRDIMVGYESLVAEYIKSKKD